MRILAAIGWCLGLLMLIYLPAGAARVETGDNQSSCTSLDPATGRALSQRAIVPASIRSCETAAVSLTVRVSCDGRPLHVVLNFDRSGSTLYGPPWGKPIQDAQRAAIVLVEALDLATHPETLVGLVSHGEQPHVDQDLTNDASAVTSKIRHLRAVDGGPDNLTAAIEKSVTMLKDGRSPVKRQPFEVMVIISDGGAGGGQGGGAFIRAAARAQGEGILLMSVCAQSQLGNCDRWWSYLPTSPLYNFRAESTRELEAAVTQLANEIRNLALRDVIVSETLPEGLDVVPGHVLPTPSSITGRTMTWAFGAMPSTGESITYSVRSRSVLTYPLTTSVVTFTDTQGRDGIAIVPTAVLTITGPCEPPTATPTSTSLATPTPTTTPATTATPPPARAARPVFLPLALKEECVIGQRRVDVALVIDASTSMLEPTREGRTKLAAAIDAVRLFLDELDLPHDQATIVEFNGGVRLLQGLTGSRADLNAALDRIEVQRQTRIDLGVETAHRELASVRRRAGNEPVMIVLTDGRANPVGPEEAVEKARLAKADDITIFTIGLGEDLDLWAMEAMASKPSYFYRAPDGEDLKDIYQAIAVEIPCPAEQYWGRR